MRASFYTLGCKVNQYETQILMQLFAAQGYDIVQFGDAADVCVINTCTVTDTGDRKNRQALRRARRENPQGIIALTGCMPQAFPEQSRLFSEADVVTGAYNRKGLLDAVAKRLATGERVVDIHPHKRGEEFESMRADRFAQHTRAFIKIEDGCDRFCTYCIIPKARGPVRSKPLAQLRAELAGLAGEGYREAVLVGINLSSYGRDLGLRLIDAVRAASDTAGIERVRLGSLEPELLTREDMEEMSSLPKLCPQFHLSLQSGCDATLRRMNRQYDTAKYMDIVRDLRRSFRNCAVTTDIMVGFPQETEAEFLESMAFFRSVGFARAHVFAYSAREGTPAAALSGQVPQRVKAVRSKQMLEAAQQSMNDFLRFQSGLTEPVLFEMRNGEFAEGYTANYTFVRIKTPLDLQWKILPVRLVGVTGEGCVGEIMEQSS